MFDQKGNASGEKEIYGSDACCDHEVKNDA